MKKLIVTNNYFRVLIVQFISVINTFLHFFVVAVALQFIAMQYNKKGRF